MKSVLEQLYYGRIAPYADPPLRGERTLAANERYEQAYETFTAKLNPDMRRECNRMMEAYTEETTYEMMDSFIQGYRLGARMMLDTFANE